MGTRFGNSLLVALAKPVTSKRISVFLPEIDWRLRPLLDTDVAIAALFLGIPACLPLQQSIEIARFQKMRNKPKRLASAGRDFVDQPFLSALAEREEAVRQGKLTTIIFIRNKNAKVLQSVCGRDQSVSPRPRS